MTAPRGTKPPGEVHNRMSIATTQPRLLPRAWSGLLLLILAFLIIYPTGMRLLGALTDANPVIDGFANSVLACTGGTALAVVIGLFFAWIVVRADTPFASFIAK